MGLADMDRCVDRVSHPEQQDIAARSSELVDRTADPVGLGLEVPGGELRRLPPDGRDGVQGMEAAHGPGAAAEILLLGW